MSKGWFRTVGGCATVALLVGCGGGGTDGGNGPVGGTGTDVSEVVNGIETGAALPLEPRVRTGVFVDSPVAGLTYATETRSGVTDDDGRFEYLPGESVTFSIGALVLPTVDAGERLTPIDLGRASRDVERFAINVARLLQSLDADGNADNGITVPSAAGRIATTLDFDVEASVFENDPGVIALVANAGGRADGLISESAALEHFSVALGAASTADATAAVAGFWKRESDGSSSPIGYVSVSTGGELSLYRHGLDPHYGASADCFEVEHRTLTPLSGDDFLAAQAPGGGRLDRMTLSRPSVDRLVISQRESEREIGWTIATAPVSGRTPADLELCTGESFQAPPVETTNPGAELAGLWSVDDAEERDPDDRAIRYLQMDEYGSGRLFVARQVFGPAPAFERDECHAPLGELYVHEDGDGETHRGFAGLEDTVVEVIGNHSREYVDHVGRSVALTRDGEALLFELEGESERRLSPADIDVTELPVCGEEGVSPLSVVQGLWRERGDGLFGDYLHIGSTGDMSGVAPAPGGDACYLDVPSASLTPLGGLDFLSVRDDDGTSRTLRMALDGDSLTIREIGPDGSATPVRWLERARGLLVDRFARCETAAEENVIADLEPLAGQWSRVSREEVTNWGPNDSESIYRQYEYVEISATGRYSLTYPSIGEFYSYSKEELCRYSRYEDSLIAFEVIGDELFRIDGDLTAIVREGDVLTMTNSRGYARVYERSDTDLDALPFCYTGLSDTDPVLGPLDGLWLLESPDADDPSFTALRLDTERRENDEHFLYRFDADADCHAVEALSLEVASEDRVVLESVHGEGGVVGTFGIVDGELDITLRSGTDTLSGVRDGRYPRLLGLDVGRLLAGFGSVHHPSECSAGGAR